MAPRPEIHNRKEIMRQHAQEIVPPPSSGNASPTLHKRSIHPSTPSPNVQSSGEGGLPTVHHISDDEDEGERGHRKRNGHIPSRQWSSGSLCLRFLQCVLTSSVSRYLRKLIWRYRVFLGCVLFMFYLDHVVHFYRRYLTYFGRHPIHGGSLGVKWDRKLLQKVIDQTYARKTKELADMGIVLPTPHRTEATDLLQINTNAALREFLVRRETRARHLIEMEDIAEKFQRGCEDVKSSRYKDSPLSFLERFDRPSNMGGIPKSLLLVDVPSWPQPRPGKPPSLTKVTFNTDEMRHLIEDYYLPILSTYDSLTDLDDRIRLWTICALHFYGGIFLGKEAIKRPDFVSEILNEKTAALFSDETDCKSPKGFVLFHGNNATKHDVLMIGMTPRSPHLRCVLNKLERSDTEKDATGVLSAFFMESAWETSQTQKQLKGEKNLPAWERVSSKCYYGRAHTTHECCHGNQIDPMAAIPSFSTASAAIKNSTRQKSSSSLYIGAIDLQSLDQKMQSKAHGPITVDIVEREGTEAPLKSQKVHLEDIMNKHGVAPGWLCCRCLKTPLYGSIEKCSAVCNSGFEDIMCSAADEPERSEVVVEVTVHTREFKEGERRIPRIVHQTWFEELSPDRYPQLVRLQQSWKSSGWDYRFYTDEDARNYIVKNFPLRFVDAFDSIIPGAYKADLFRYLVLMKEGGLYADVDIMLDATLDNFVDPHLSFFVPRDVVGEYADESFCLWNGLIGAAPGHPFIIRTVERLVGLILQRADMYDMEQDVCRRVGRTMENWKVRAEPLLLASGPCALGVAVNDVLQKPSLDRLDIGWIPAEDIKYGDGEAFDHGDALIMVGDKYDLGSFRISDPERNIVLASTDLPGVVKTPREMGNPTRSELLHRQQRRPVGAHYSEAAKGDWVWGVHNVYHDDYVNNEVIKFDVIYN